MAGADGHHGPRTDIVVISSRREGRHAVLEVAGELTGLDALLRYPA